MAVVLTDGFDMYNGTGTNTGVQTKWGLFGGSYSLITGRFGGQAVRSVSNSSVLAFDGRITRTLPASVSSCSIGTAVRTPSATVSTGVGINLAVGLTGTFQCGWQINPNGSITANRYTGYAAGTALGTSAAAVILVNTWHYVETEIVISSTVGRITVKVDGVTVLNLTAQNTQNAGTAFANEVSVGSFNNYSNPGQTVDFDDIYVLDTATSLGERRIETLRPAADSVVTWTPNSGANNYSRINETLVDGDTSYVQTATIGNADLYGLTSLASTPANIDAVNVVSFSEKTDATTRTIYNSVKSGATTSDGAALALSASYNRFDRLIALDPNTSAAWTASGVNNLLIGPKLAS